MLTVGAGNVVVTAPVPVSGATASQLWYTNPGFPLDEIGNFPHEGFPSWNTAGEAAAYQYINSQLGIIDLRQAYENLNNSSEFAVWQQEMLSWSHQSPPPPNETNNVPVSSSDWQNVTTQLLAELNAISVTAPLYNNLQEYNSNVLLGQEGLLTQLGQDFVSQPTVDSTIPDLIEGLLYTFISALPVAGGIAGNVFETAFNLVMDLNSIPTGPLEVSYENLWSTLNQQIPKLWNQLSSLFSTIVENWNMLQPTGILASSATSPFSPISLVWPVDDAPLQDQAVQAYAQYALQTLGPNLLWVIRCGGLEPSNPAPPPPWSDPPGNAGWSYYDYGGYVYYLLGVSNWSGDGLGFEVNYPSTAILDDFANYVPLSYLWPPTPGWSGFQLIDFENSSGNPPPWAADTLPVAITNMSERTLIAILDAQAGAVEYLGNSAQTIPPYGTLNFAADHHSSGGLRIAVTIIDQLTNNGSAIFQVHLEDDKVGNAPFVPERIWVDLQQTVAGFTIASPQVEPNWGAYGKGYRCGSIAVQIYLDPQFSPATQQLSLIATGRGNSSQLQVVGLGLNDSLPYLLFQQTLGTWTWAGALSSIASNGSGVVPLRSLTMANGNSGNLQVIGLGQSDDLPYLIWQNSSGQWIWAGLLPYQDSPTPVPFQSLATGLGNAGLLQVIGLGLSNNLPYLAWQDSKGGWHLQGEIGSFAKNGSGICALKSIAIGPGNNKQLQAVCLGAADNLPYLIWQDSSGHWYWAGAISSLVSNGNDVVPLSSVVIATGNDVQLQAIGLGLNDNLPYLIWQDPKGGWHWYGALPNPDSVQFSQVFTGNNDTLQVIGLGLADNLPYLIWQDSAGTWTWSGAIQCTPPPPQPLAWSSLETGNGFNAQMDIIGLGAANGLPSLVYQTPDGQFHGGGVMELQS